MPSPCARRIAALLTLFLVLVLLWSGMDQAGPPQEEGALLVCPELILKGAVPYRDFETAEGPANLYLLAVPTVLFGAGIGIERAVGLLWRLLIAAALFALLQRWGLTVAVGGTLLAGVFLLSSGLVAGSGSAAMACALWSLWCGSTAPERRRSLAGGLLAGTAFLFQPQTGLAAGLANVPLLLSMPSTSRRSFWLAAALALLPLLILAAVAGLAPCFHCLFALNRHPSEPLFGWSLTLLVLHGGVMLFSLAAAWLYRSTPAARVLLAVIVLALGLSVGVKATAAPVFLPLAFAPAAVTLLLARLGLPEFGPGRALAAVSLVVLASAANLPDLFREAGRETWRELRGGSSGATDLDGHDERFFPLTAVATVMAVGPIVEDLEHLAKPGQRLFVGAGDLRQPRGSDTYLYHLLPQLTPASYYLELHPNVATGRLAADVATADWLILNRAWDVAGLPAEPIEVIRTQFERCARHGPFELYRRKVRAQGT